MCGGEGDGCVGGREEDVMGICVCISMSVYISTSPTASFCVPHTHKNTHTLEHMHRSNVTTPARVYERKPSKPALDVDTAPGGWGERVLSGGVACVF